MRLNPLSTHQPPSRPLPCPSAPPATYHHSHLAHRAQASTSPKALTRLPFRFDSLRWHAPRPFTNPSTVQELQSLAYPITPHLTAFPLHPVTLAAYPQQATSFDGSTLHPMAQPNLTCLPPLANCYHIGPSALSHPCLPFAIDIAWQSAV